MTASITARLLFASRQAYQVQPDASVATAPGWDQIGYVAAPTGFLSGPEMINAATLGACADGIILAFRGTLPPASPDTPQVILDWLVDTDAALVTDPNYTGDVHAGFRDDLATLWPAVSAALATLRQTPAFQALPLYVTGHSKGGAMAMLAASRLQPANAGNIYVSTYAAARCGDQTFANAYNLNVPHSARYEFQDDIVPHLPPTDSFISILQNVPALRAQLQNATRGYVSVQELHFIDWDGQLEGESSVLELQRLTHLLARMVAFQFDVIIKDHSIDPGSGYANALTGGA